MAKEKMFLWDGHPFGWNEYLGLLLDVDEDTNFKHTWLTRPEHITLFGDKDVAHRVMEGSIQPIVKGLPHEWSGVIPPSGWYTDGYWSYGTSNSKCVRFHYINEKWYGHQIDLITRNDRQEIHLRQIVNSVPETDWPISNYTMIAYKDPVRGWSANLLDVTVQFLNPLPYYWLEYMEEIRPYSDSDAGALSECIRNTIQKYTTLDTNNYANAVEMIDTINDIRRGKIADLIEDSKDWWRITHKLLDNVDGKNARTILMKGSKQASSAWLKYRYAYQTTKSDLEQATRAVIGEYLGTLDSTRVLRGQIPITDGLLRVKMRLHDKTAPNFEKMLISMNQYGLMPGLYNLWDMIPFSFIADWGSHLGDYLQDIDQRIFFSYYEIDELLVSRKQISIRDEIWGPTTYRWYDRSFLTEMPQWEIYEEDKTSNKVKIKRFIDGVALTIGSL
jgi:hypothetical protein